ncbi:MAG: hypothetical protein HKN14_03525 [Marinicaulis sp.]|nr:hypothetical protein [Marinicaulis sp.]NNL90496.1 hypothetical protein [Marinicaulis sp.]
MMKILTLCFSTLAAVSAITSTAAAKKAKPLFRADDTIKVTINGPIKQIQRKAPYATDPYDATLILEGDAAEEHAIILSARGKSRRNKNLCTFPPLRVEFKVKPDDPSLFDGQKRLKLVTHCRTSSRFQQYYLLEYTAYRLLNILSPTSLKVRLAEIDYYDSDKETVVATRIGFFIEDTDDAAKRNDLKEIDVPDIEVAQLNHGAAGQYAVMQYMIGNLDWSMHNGPDGVDCCHNTKLMGETKQSRENLIPVAYDFDYSGLVDSPYAAPPTTVRVRDVRKRYYRGMCVHNAAAQAAVLKILQQRDALYKTVDEITDLDKRSRNRTVAYLDDFFEDIATPEDVQKNLLKVCRGDD